MTCYNKYKLIFLALSGFLTQGLLGQEAPQRQLRLGVGVYHINMLDKQASPLVHKGLGRTVQLGFDLKKEVAWWKYELNYGWLGFHASNPDFRFEERDFEGTYAALRISHLRKISESEKWTLRVGAMLQQEAMLDFEGVADFPWIFAQGGLFVNGHWEYKLSERQSIAGKISLPLFGWITDMPYNQIPRVEGRAPDEISVIRKGTRMASWGSFQRIDLGVDYSLDFSNKWRLNATYQWAWFHDAVPRDFWAYQGALQLGIGYRW